MIASAMAVELMVTILHHPDGANANADLGGSTAAAAAVESAANAFVAKPTSALSSSLGVSVHHMHAH